MKIISPLLALLLISSCSQMPSKERSVASEKGNETGNRVLFNNYERKPFKAGHASYSSSASYTLGQSAPISSEEAKLKIMDNLQNICLKNTNNPLDTESVIFSYRAGSDTGGDFGDMIMNPIRAVIQRNVSFEGYGKCVVTDNQDPVVEALKKEDTKLFDRDPGSYIAFGEIRPNLATARITFYKTDKNGKNIQLQSADLPEIKFAFEWNSNNKVRKEIAVESKIIESTSTGEIYSKVDLSVIKKNVSSWNTGNKLFIYVNNSKANVTTKISADEITGAMDCKVYIKDLK
jgi:hypothetical protein